jgi:diacylglycerol kinase family enzyme
MHETKIPAFLNSEAGSADEAKKILENAGPFEAQSVPPDKLRSAIESAVSGGAKRILVSGGDGTIGTAATVLAGTEVELAVLPGGTLNHFARDNGIPTDLAEALEVAATGTTRKVDVGYVGDRLFLNTSSIGAYVTFVRVRERFERRFGYHIASAFAFLRIMTGLRRIRIEVEIEGKTKIYTSPVVFVGVGQRELQMPSLGSRVTDGDRGLQLLVVRGRSGARLLSLALSAVARGTKSASRTPEMDSFMTDRCTIDLEHSATGVSVDGETVAMQTPLEYRIAHEALTIVVPAERPE